MSISLSLPPKGAFRACGESDPLDYYYRPLVGKMYVERINMLLRLVPERRFSRVLEIGYGSGLLAPTLVEVADEYHGLDLDTPPDQALENLAHVGLESRVNLVQADLRSVDMGQFDLVVAVSVFEHIAEVDEVLDALEGHLAPGGLLLVGMPMVSPLMTTLFRLIGYSGIDDHHVTSFPFFLEKAKARFSLLARARMFPWMPTPLALYHGALLQKD